ncbi:MAG: response regulator [Opitutaceae bacterium]
MMNLIIVEDDPMTRNNLQLLLQGEPKIQSIQGFASSEEAIDSDCWSQADILLTDIDLPGLNGDELIAWAGQKQPHVTSVAYTIYENRDTVFAAIRAGACGYILKGTSPRKLIEALQEVYQGGSPMTPKIARKVINTLHQSPKADSNLSHREAEILRLIEKGHTYKEVASEIGVSPHTVHAHLKNIYGKVQAHSRDEAVQKARRLGWI